jgi:L-ribulose-5-phosphate 4-epimerase
MSQWTEAKKLVLEATREMLRKGLVVGTSGNVSLRLPPSPSEKDRRLLAITPSSRYYDAMTAEDIQIIDFNGEPVEGDLPPSMEARLHVGVYRARAGVNAVVHSHSVYASAISVAGLNIPPILEDQVVFLGGEIRLAAYAASGSDAMVAGVIDALGERNAVLLPNHGAVAAGRTMREALTAAELLEKTARTYYLALSLKKVNLLPERAIEEGLAFFRRLQG